MKEILLILTFLTILGCSKDNVDVNTNPKVDVNTNPKSDPVGFLKLTNVTSLSDTPFSKPRETIIFENNLYVIDDINTYKFDFNTNIWELLNTNGSGIAVYPFLEYNVSFIRDNKWFIINQSALWAFTFSTKTWTKIKQFNDNKLRSTIGTYDNGSLYLFSDIGDKVYKYDFDTNNLILHSTFQSKGNYGQLVKSVFKVGNDYYFTKLTGYDRISIYKWVNNFTSFEYLDDFNSTYIAQGSGFVYKDNIIFGLGGEATATASGTITSYKLNKRFYYYNITTRRFKIVENDFSEGRYVCLPIEYNNKFYLLGGRTIINNESFYRKTLEQLNFELF